VDRSGSKPPSAHFDWAKVDSAFRPADSTGIGCDLRGIELNMLFRRSSIRWKREMLEEKVSNCSLVGSSP